jgi:hypothetical protein
MAWSKGWYPMNPAFVVALFLPLPFAASVPITPVKVNHLPPDLKIKGELVVAKQWKDSEGENLVALSSLSKTSRLQDDERSAYLYGTQWRKIGSEWRPVWTMSDKVEACNLDMTCAFRTESLEITDLDNNGIAEVSFLYRTGCRGDISPDTQKLLLYEGPRKYALRGTVKVVMPTEGRKKEVFGGVYKADPAFDKGPPAFLRFAVDQWAKFGVEKL